MTNTWTKIIAHRGNLDGPNPEKENHPDYISEALNQGFNVEIDVWVIGNKFYLGHDEPTYELGDHFQYHGTWYSSMGSLWLHCKNFEALDSLNTILYNTFFHDQDDFTLTSSGYIWTYPRNLPLFKKSIAVMPERVPDWDVSQAGGICTDFPNRYKNT